MITKIISSGKGGVEKAALGLAGKLDLQHGGWDPDRPAGIHARKFSIGMRPSGDNYGYAEKNIQQADGTLVLFRRKYPGGLFSMVRKAARKAGKPLMMLNLSTTSKFECALSINKWITEENIAVLYVTGEHVRQENPTYQDVADILESALYLGQVEQSKPVSTDLEAGPVDVPVTMADAVKKLMSRLPLKDRVLIANMTYAELGGLNLTLGSYIRDNFGIWPGNMDLLAACRKHADDPGLTMENVSVVIIQALWKELKKSHRLRVVKV